MSETEGYARELLAAYSPARFLNSADGKNCDTCGKHIGIREGECTGWHPAFKCACGYETTHPAAANWPKCIHCGREQWPDVIGDAEEVG